MRVNKKKITAVLTTGALVAALLAGCGSKKGADSKSNDDVTTIRVGTGTSYKPYCYLDKNGKPAGYELEVLKAVDKLLPQYKFEYETSDFSGLFSSLSQGKLDVVAHQVERNKEREENYLFGEEPYTTYVTYIVVPESVNNVNSLADLAGKRAFLLAGGNAEYILENYNKEHPDAQINLDIVQALSDDEKIAGFKSGKWDFEVETKRDVEKENKDYDAGLKTVGEPIQTSSTYYVFQKGNTKLQKAFDGAIRKLKKSGKLAEISEEILGGDYTESE